MEFTMKVHYKVRLSNGQLLSKTYNDPHYCKHVQDLKKTARDEFGVSLSTWVILNCIPRISEAG